MKKQILLVVLLIVALPHLAVSATPKNKNGKSVKVGGVQLYIPPPPSGFVEASDDHRGIMELFVPQTNRLVAGFVMPEDLPKLVKGSDKGLTRYGLVEVPRQGEFMTCSESDFREVIGSAKDALGDSLDSTLKDAEEEFNSRMKSLDIDNVNVSIEKPLQLGCLFSKPNAYGFGMVTMSSIAGIESKLAAGVVLLRVKKKVLFLYLYADYKNEDSVKWIRKATEEWSDSILKANRS